MRIGILTYHFANNYGAALQAYSLQCTLEKLGHRVEFIDYHSKQQYSNNSLILDNSSIGNVIRNLIRLPHYFERKRRIDLFKSFRRSVLNLSPNCFYSMEDVLKYVNNNYDIIIVGSDQIWNPKIDDFDEIYFKISKADMPVYVYAASLGTAKSKDIKSYRDFILNFKEISVREDASIKILQDVDKKINSIGVLDPTLLLNKKDFESIAQHPRLNNKKYIICYFIGRKNARLFKQAANSISNKFSLDIYYINVNYGVTSYGKNIINDCGPREFLGLLKNAALVCTNSFHAVALSIQFRTPFFTFENTSLGDTRKTDLLRRLNMSDRIVYDGDISGIDNYDLNFNNIEESLDKYRTPSLKFLNKIK